jgi:hypothetical protein
VEEEGGVNVYGFLNNDALNRVDKLGLMKFSHKWDMSCDPESSVNYLKTVTLKPWFWKDGGSFTGWRACRRKSSAVSVGRLCNTDTWLRMKLKNDTCCCESFLITCRVFFEGKAAGMEYANVVIKSRFLGGALLREAYEFLPGTPIGPPATTRYEAAAHVSKVYSGSLNVPCDEERQVLLLTSYDTAEGFPEKMEDEFNVSCSAKCVN